MKPRLPPQLYAVACAGSHWAEAWEGGMGDNREPGDLPYRFVDGRAGCPGAVTSAFGRALAERRRATAPTGTDGTGISRRYIMAALSNAPLKKIPATIVTGFLGSGKTTLIRHVLQTAGARRIALIVNEFGDVGVDGDVLQGCGVPSCGPGSIIELANGCICCTVADDFIPAIERLLALDPTPEHIVIETSGLALPKPLVKAFDWPDVRRRLTVDGVIAVVDAAAVADGRFADNPAKLAAQRAADPSVEHENPLEEVYEDQLLCADLVVLNKIDLVEASVHERVEHEIRAAIPRAVKVVSTRKGCIDAAVLLGLAAAAEDDLASRPSHHDAETEHDHDDFESVIVPVRTVAEPDAFLRTLAELAERHDVLRVKGFIAVEGKPMRLLVQGVGSRFTKSFDRAWASGEDRQGRLVVIGEKGLDRAAIRDALATT